MNLLEVYQSTQLESTKKTYKSVILLALFMHCFFVILFHYLAIKELVFYHIGSVIFYIVMFRLAGMEKFRIIVAAIHVEVCLFVLVSVFHLGWEPGFSMYLFAMASLVYFCPYKRKYIPYFFSLGEVILFLSLKFYCTAFLPDINVLPQSVVLAFYLSNCLACFSIILIVARLSNLSAGVTLKKLEDENEQLTIEAHYDHLTTLISRSYLKECLENRQYDTFAIALGDIDNFKQVNDRYGHKCGDYILQSIAAMMKTLSSDHTDICRWGGEEFVIIFYDLPQEQIAEQIKHLCSQIENKKFHYHNAVLHITMTFGIAMGQAGDDAGRLLDEADLMMYEGKRKGKNRIITKTDLTQ